MQVGDFAILISGNPTIDIFVRLQILLNSGKGKQICSDYPT